MDFTIIAVGDELLRGDTVDTNSSWIAKKLTERGHRIRRIVIVGDKIDDIVEEIREMREISDWIIVTGGLGTTPDDVTREAVAKALGRDLVESERARISVEKRYNVDSKVIRKVIMLPDGSEVIENDVGMAPGFVIDNILVMPGVPAEMKDIFEKIADQFGREEYAMEVIETRRREAEITPVLEKIAKEYQEVSVGSYPGKDEAGMWKVTLKITGKNAEIVKEVKRRLEEELERL